MFAPQNKDLMSYVMQVTGLFLGVSGGVHLFNQITDMNTRLTANVARIDSKCKRIANLAANVLLLVGSCYLTFSLVQMGAAFYGLSETTEFLIGMQKALDCGLPNLINAVVAHVLGISLRELAR